MTIDSRILRIWGAIYSVFTLLLWLFAMYRTLPSVWDGSIFEAPCLAKPAEAEESGQDSVEAVEATSAEKLAGPSSNEKS